MGGNRHGPKLQESCYLTTETLLHSTEIAEADSGDFLYVKLTKEGCFKSLKYLVYPKIDPTWIFQQQPLDYWLYLILEIHATNHAWVQGNT